MTERYDRDHLPKGEWVRYRKIGTTLMIPMVGPFTVTTREGEYPLPEGWRGFIALDSDGYPYPINQDVHEGSYELAPDTTVLEWATNHSRATGRNRDLLLALAAIAGDDDHVKIGSVLLAQVQQTGLTEYERFSTVRDLCLSGELETIHSPGMPLVYRFSAYRAWLAETAAPQPGDHTG